MNKQPKPSPPPKPDGNKVPHRTGTIERRDEYPEGPAHKVPNMVPERKPPPPRKK